MDDMRRCETCLMPLSVHEGSEPEACVRALGAALVDIKETLAAVGVALLAAGDGDAFCPEPPTWAGLID